jgi:hypothetical protein
MGAVLCRPDIVDVYVDLAVEYNLPILFFKQLPLGIEQEYPALASRFQKSISKLSSKELPLLDRLLQFYGGENAEKRKQLYLEEIAKIGPGVTQLIIHCGQDNEELRAITDSAKRRDQDRVLFTDPAMRDFLKAQKIELITWKQFRSLPSNQP